MTRKLIALLLVGLVLALAAKPGTTQYPHTGELLPEANVSASATLPWFITRVDPASVGSGNDLGSHVSATIDPASGAVYIAYYDATNKDLKVAHYVGSGGNCGTGNTWSCETVDAGGNVGPYNSISATPLGVAVAYYDSTNYALKYALYTCLLGSCSWSIYTIDTGTVIASVGKHTSLKFDGSGTPHIAYYYNSLISSDSLKYAHYVGTGGNCGDDGGIKRWQCDEIDSGNNVGQYASLDTDGNNKVHIAYYDGGNKRLRYAYQSTTGANCGPGTTWICSVIDSSTADVGRYTSLRVNQASSNQPAIAYQDVTGKKLMYAKWVGTGGNCGYNSVTFKYMWQCDALADMGNASGVSLEIDDVGEPFIAYQDASDNLAPSALSIARPTKALGQIQGNCGPQVGLIYTWQCDILDGGGSYTDEAAAVSLVVNSSGVATIAYYESDSYYGGGNLKVTYQRLRVYLPLVMRNSSS